MTRGARGSPRNAGCGTGGEALSLPAMAALRIQLLPPALLALQAASVVAGIIAWSRSAPAEPSVSLLRSGPAPLHTGTTSMGARRALELLRETLRAADERADPNVPRRAPHATARVRFEVRPSGRELLYRRVGYEVRPGEVIIWAKFEGDLPTAVSWFFEREAAARWFTPGADGLEIVAANLVRIPLGAAETEPGFASRSFAFNRPIDDRWAIANRLQKIFDHSHTAADFTTAADLARHPELAPILNGKRADQAVPLGWQPNLNPPIAVDHVANRLAEQLRRHPDRPAAAFGQNDSWRWDQSEETLAAVAPHRHFRDYPNYSNTLFGFLNKVAARLAPDFPDRFISTYAYQWTEDSPAFPVAPNILPFLTADRSQWFDAAYRAEDEALIRRWLAAGPRVVGLYDYYYGAPYVVPRPTLYAVREPIPFAYRAGARAFYAEAFPNWGLDGPKLWLAAQLLWAPLQQSEQLLEEYYTRYWREAAEPMRRFFALCERQYLTQPPPAYWLKYYKDDHQRLLFPPGVRAELDACLSEAERLANHPILARRLALVRQAFTVADLFCRHDERRDALARLTHDPATPTEAIRAAVAHADAAREALLTAYAQLLRDHPLALGGELPGDYLRNDPRPRALRRLHVAGLAVQPAAGLTAGAFAGRAPAPTGWSEAGIELLRDPSFATVAPKPVHPFIAVDWNTPSSPWWGTGEPFRTRRLDVRALPDGRRVLRYAGVNQEGFAQTVPAQPGALYRGTVQVRGRVSPGNMTFLLLVCTDSSGRFTDIGHIDRLPLGDWTEWTTLEFTLRAPPNAQRLMFSLRTLYQVGDDFVEFTAPSLRWIPQG